MTALPAPRLIARVTDHIEAVAADGSVLDQFVALTMLKRKIKQVEKRLTDAIAEREAELLEDYTERGITGERHAATGKAVYINRRIWARPAIPKDQAADALELAGLGEFVERGFNTSTLSAYFREQAKEYAAEHGVPADLEALLPETLRGAIALTEDHNLGLKA